jgi:hypothetical protein
MIEQILNRDYLHAIATAVAEGAAREAVIRERGAPARRGGGGALDPLADVSPGELREFAEALSAGLEPPHRSAASGPEDFAYIPRNMLLSIVQSAVEEAIETHQPDAIAEPPSRRLERRRSEQPVPTITARRLKDVPPVAGSQRRVWKPFEVAGGGWVWLSDPRWAFSLAHKIWRDATGDVAPFVAAPQTVPIANNARVFLVGDWGTGLDRATNVAEQLKKEMARGRGRQQVVIHLGDVYYSGTEREIRTRFLQPWPVDPGDDTLSFTLPGNHDMYSGGHAYFGSALGDRRFAGQGGCSYFALRNDFWQFLGLDTAYEDGGLHGEQAAWARAAAHDAPAGCATVLLSHHQPFSAHEDGNPVLRRKIAPVLATQRVAAWFWGHEHRCIEYGPTTVEGQPLPFSSCLGHGGVPEYVAMKKGETRPAPWVYEYLEVNSHDLQPWDTFGFAVLELDDAAMSVRYIDENGVNHHSVASVPRGPA